MLRIPWVVMAIVAMLWSPGAAANSADPHRVLVFGDSLSAAWGMPESYGWVALLQERLTERDPDWEVINASISGETTAGGRERLPAVLEREEPDVVILGLGGNDGLRGLSLAAMRDNLEAMVDAIEAHSAQPLLLGIRIPPSYGRRYTERFEAVFEDLATDRELPFEPFLLKAIVFEDGMLMDDGIHPTPEAQPFLLEAVWPHLKPLLNAVEDDRSAGLGAPWTLTAGARPAAPAR